MRDIHIWYETVLGFWNLEINGNLVVREIDGELTSKFPTYTDVIIYLQYLIEKS